MADRLTEIEAADPTLVEQVARAAFVAFQHDVAVAGRATWESVPEDHRITFRKVSEAALAVAAEASDALLWKVNSTHHFHGEVCLCGWRSAVSRERTEHLTGLAVQALLGGGT